MHVVVECVHEYADARTRARLRRVWRDLRVFGLDGAMPPPARRAFAAWRRAAAPRAPRVMRNSWFRRRRRTDETPVMPM